MTNKLQAKKPLAKFRTEELAKLFNFKPQGTSKFVSINTDSRKIEEDQYFMPLKGEKFNGHDFINDVLQKNNIFSFCQIANISKVDEKFKSNLIIVESTLDAYHKLANYYKKKINPRVVAVTGSSGKTTVKDLISSVLSVKYKTHKTEANYNNEFGVPKTILEMPEDTQVLVLELAMRGKGQIKQLSLICEPDIAVITSIGSAHVGILGDLYSIVKAKGEILENINKGGIAILYNDPRLIDFANELKQRGELQYASITFDLGLAKGIYYGEGKSNFIFDRKPYSVNALGKVHVLNSICAILAAQYLKVTDEGIRKGLLNFNVPSGRGNLIKLEEYVYLIDESYNANPDSVKIAVSNLINCWGEDYKKVLVLGELAELGEHKDKLLIELNDWLATKPLAKIITVGNKLKQVTSHENVKDADKCCGILEKLLIPKTVILVKGSHVAGLEEVAKHLQKLGS